MAEPFEVEPNHLDAAAGKLQTVADDNGHKTYLAQWLELPESKEAGMNAVVEFPEIPGITAAEGYDHPGAITA